MFRTGRINEAERDAWVRRELALLPSKTRLLDAGCGKQPYRGASAHLEYVAQDFGAYDLAKERDAGAGGLRPDECPYGKLDYACDIASIFVPTDLPSRSFAPR